MNNGYIEQIYNRIINTPKGSVFVNSEFNKPKYSKSLGEYPAVDPDTVAKALAKCYHWTITPCGDTALNMLGLSTLVTAVWSYISDRPYKTYEWDNTKIEFKHRTNKEVTGLSSMTILVVQAL